MAAFIGHPSRADDAVAREAAGTFLEDELCHHRHTTDDLVADDRMSLATKHLYVTLRHESARQHRSPAHEVTTPAVAGGPTSGALDGQRDRLAAEVVALHAEGERRSRELETAWSEVWAARRDLGLANQQIAAIHRSRAWRLASFLLRATGRVPATRRGNAESDAPLA
jgi:hypothetical protein